jgi:hypothetical protein
MHCATCNEELPAGALHCTACGTRVVSTPGPGERLEVRLDEPDPQLAAPRPPAVAPTPVFRPPELPQIPAYQSGPPPNNGMAIASMVVGIAAIVFCYFAIVPSIVAVVLGAVALRQINAANGGQSGRGMAITGVVLGSIWIGLTIIGVIAIAAASG